MIAAARARCPDVFPVDKPERRDSTLTLIGSAVAADSGTASPAAQAKGNERYDGFIEALEHCVI